MFDKIKKLRKQGKIPVIELNPGARIVPHKLPPGRPRKYPPGTDQPSRYVGRHGKNRPRCQARGCTNMLRIHQPVACSETCATRIVNDALLRLKQCGISKSELEAMYSD